MRVPCDGCVDRNCGGCPRPGCPDAGFEPREDIAIALDVAAGHVWLEGLTVRDQVVAHAGDLLPSAQKAGVEILRYVSNLWPVILVPILALFFLKDGEELTCAVEGWFQRQQHRQLLREIFTDLHDLLAPLRGSGKTVAGYGASATVTTLIHNFDLGPFLSYLVDDNPAIRNVAARILEQEHQLYPAAISKVLSTGFQD